MARARCALQRMIKEKLGSSNIRKHGLRFASPMVPPRPVSSSRSVRSSAQPRPIFSHVNLSLPASGSLGSRSSVDQSAHMSAFGGPSSTFFLTKSYNTDHRRGNKEQQQYSYLKIMLLLSMSKSRDVASSVITCLPNGRTSCTVLARAVAEPVMPGR